MSTSHQAFTLIEIVFVIVILSILGVVAIPKLSATRDDARLVVVGQSLSDALVEISSYATAHGKTEENLSAMSDAVKYLVRSGNAVEDLPNRAIIVSVPDVLNCVTFKISSGVFDENLTVIHGNANGNVLCLNLQKMTKDNNYNLQLRGASIDY